MARAGLTAGEQVASARTCEMESRWTGVVFVQPCYTSAGNRSGVSHEGAADDAP